MEPYIIYLAVLFIGIPLLLALLIMMTFPIFWVLLGAGVVIYIVIAVSIKIEKGYITTIKGNVFLEGVDGSKASRLYLYPDKLTINNIQIIPIEQILKAEVGKWDKGFRYSRVYHKRETYYLVVTFKNKEGAKQSFQCHSKVNPYNGGLSYEGMKNAINRLIGLKEEKPSFPTKPYKL